ncbi:MAG: STAS domain-containing protein [Mogibacterium sp.]|nr:STAS domain-containing protein [Mogibacterium sp.]
MNANVTTENGTMTAYIEGRLDSSNAVEFDNMLQEKMDGVSEIIMDLTKLRYMSSAGLRVLLSLQKKMNAEGGSMVVKNPSQMVMDVFEATGFDTILTIEQGE